jgi:hypothetical protein
MDPVQQGEVYEVTVQLEGPVTQPSYAAFKAALDQFLAAARALTDPPGGGPGSRRLKVRESRAGVRPRSQ